MLYSGTIWMCPQENLGIPTEQDLLDSYCVEWKTPPDGKMKINFDGAADVKAMLES